MPKITGFELRRMINANNTLRERSVTFIFYSTADEYLQVLEACRMTLQLFCLKGTTFEEAEGSLRVIPDYWRLCKHPNSFGKNGTVAK